MTLQWTGEELLLDQCVCRALASFQGDPNLQCSPRLPIEAEKDAVLKVLSAVPVTAVQAPPASGKTLKLPGYLLDLNKRQHSCELPVLVVQPSTFAAQLLVKGLVQHFDYA